ncbi:ABC transporter permease [Collinsella sp. zg1085]|uniref:ABC transporter permease n=1 Tax=Collinsella sp. zg1085 TaxID=2844380 RepID=UPI001C0DD725|nr:ABC transporter permease [Collinsella sp. zg1085]QWT17156.1 ABC transporter permease [Collinsella sp. zg1085]
MSILARFTWANLIANRVRTAVSLIGIALSCALITAILASVFSLQHGVMLGIQTSEGIWQASVASLSRAGIDWLRTQYNIDAFTHTAYLGAVDVSPANIYSGYQFMTLLSAPDTSEGLLPPVSLTEGELPQAANEIALPSDYRGRKLMGSGIESSEELAVGTQINLQIGQRENKDGAILSRSAPVEYTDTSKAGHAETSEVNEAVTQTHEQSFVVSGFYDIARTWVWETRGSVAFVSPHTTLSAYSYDAYFSFRADGNSVADNLASLVASAPGYAHAPGTELDHTLHTNLQSASNPYGIGTELLSIWLFAAFLIIVVMITSITLMYNAFAISVAEQTRQFGLLASLGATKRQLRLCIYREAFILAALGIPIGMGIGLLGTAFVFSLTRSGLALLFNIQAEQFSLVISWELLALSASISTLAMVFSSLSSAIRAGNLRPIQAIRQIATPHVSKQQKKQATHTVRNLAAWLAHKNIRRARARGHITVISLAAAVTFIMVSITLSGYLDGYVDQQEPQTHNTLQVNLFRNNSTSSAITGAASVENIFHALNKIPEIEGIGWYTSYSLTAHLSSSIVDDASQESGLTTYGNLLEDNSYIGHVILSVIDNEQWKRGIEQVGLNPELYANPSIPRGILIKPSVNPSSTKDDAAHIQTEQISTEAEQGTAELYTSIRSIENQVFTNLSLVDGKVLASYAPIENNKRQTHQALDDVLEQSYHLPVATLSGPNPFNLDTHEQASAMPNIIVPAQALSQIIRAQKNPSAEQLTRWNQSAAYGESEAHPFMSFSSSGIDQSYTLSFAGAKPVVAKPRMQQVLNDQTRNAPWTYQEVIDLTQSYRENTFVMSAIRIFTMCFTVISSLIAIANVFNTLTTSIFLRRREFAILKSIGMDQRLFRRMIARECASYAVRGLSLGLFSATGLILGFWHLMKFEYHSSIIWLMPLSLLAAIGLVLIVLLISVSYALRRSQTTNIIRSLRDELI